MKLSIVSPPEESPVDLTDAKQHLRVTHNVEDGYIQKLIDAVTGLIDGRDGFLGRCLVTQEWKLVLDRFPSSRRIDIPLPKLQTIESITYIDAAGDEQTMGEDDYRVVIDTEPGFVEAINCWPQTKCGDDATVRINFIAGYGDADDVPEAIKAWIKIYVAELYMHRELSVTGGVQLLPHILNMLENFRIR